MASLTNRENKPLLKKMQYRRWAWGHSMQMLIHTQKKKRWTKAWEIKWIWVQTWQGVMTRWHSWTRGVKRSTGLRCECHSSGWPFCPLACGGTKGARQHERAKGVRWGSWAHKTGVGVVLGVPNPPPGDYTGRYRTGSRVANSAKGADQPTPRSEQLQARQDRPDVAPT